MKSHEQELILKKNIATYKNYDFKLRIVVLYQFAF